MTGGRPRAAEARPGYGLEMDLVGRRPWSGRVA